LNQAGRIDAVVRAVADLNRRLVRVNLSNHTVE
jgi:hypothetical protein